MQKEKVRVYSLARELNMESKDLLDICRQAGIDVKNQLSSLDPDQRDLVEQLAKRGGGGTAVAVAAPPKASANLIPTVSAPIPVLSARPIRRESEPVRAPATPVKPVEPKHVEPKHAEPPAAAAVIPAVPPERTPHVPEPPPMVAAQAPETPTTPPPETTAPTMPEVAAKAPETVMTRPFDGGSRVPDLSGKPPGQGTGRIPDLNQGRGDSGAGKPRQRREVPRPAVARVASLPPLKQRPLKDVKKPQQPIVQKPIARPPGALSGSPVNVQDLLKKTPIIGEIAPPIVDEDEEGGEAGKGKVRPGGVAGRDKRHQQRADRAKQRKGRGEEEVKSTRVLLPGIEDDRPQRTKDRLKRVKQKQTGPKPRQGKIPVEFPITVRALSEAIGMRSGDLLFRLRDQGAPPTITINSIVDPVVAETIALDTGCELEIKRPVNLEEQLVTSKELPDNPEDVVPRAPIVTIMGHVDHGKTSLLDKIRRSNVAATEAGGITQVIRAWRVDHGGRPVTFLDTPGHEAFTKMRARGAQVTDIAVIVVAADDGVMPQTEEAINHAKAAGVPIVVAINKVDLPNANLNKTRQQLYGHQLIPDTMGGDTPFVETSAATGKGIDELLDMLSLVAELKELTANPKKPAQGTCLEAMLSEGEGVRATLLVQDGTLHKGDVILCGASYGRVRALYDDLGRPIQEAGPSVPVRITGLDVVPNADDPFQVIPDLAQAREIADRRKVKLVESNLFKRAPMKLETLGEVKFAELKIILKADFRGSIEAIRKELEKLYHDEVRVRVLHTAIGGITESDVQLALTSPDDTIIVGFNVVPDDRAKLLAEEKGVQIRQYDIIYNLTDDIRAALEGKLKPREDVIHLGRAVVRDTFKISRVGTIAGCYVTQGTIERSAKIRLIREGVVIYPPADRTASLESLKRFKEDTREVREGFECGLKIAGYDDVKVGDVVEAYRIEQVQRTL